MFKNNIVKEDIESVSSRLKAEWPLLEGKTILLTGGAGFLGNFFVAVFSHLNKVLSKPIKLLVIDNYITGSNDNPHINVGDPNISFLTHDVRKPLPDDLRADYVIHAAGIASPAYYQKYPLETIEVAVNGTRNLLDFSLKNSVESFLFFSSSEIYGDPHPNFVPTPETYWGNVSSIGPRSCYDESKRLGETLCRVYHKHHSVPIKIVRPFNVYGPGMKVNDYRVISTFMAKGLRGEPLPVHDNGNQTRTFCYISDATVGFLKALLRGRNGEVYNIGNDQDEINVAALAKLINEVMPRPVEVQFIDYPNTYPGGEPRRRCPDLTKARTEFGYEPLTKLKAGLARTFEWYKDIVDRERAATYRATN